MNYLLKEMVDKMYEVGDNCDKGPLGLAQKTNLTLRECIKAELITYLMYLSAADGTIAWQEARFIRDYMEYDFTIEEINQLIVKKQIYSTKFEEKVPLSIQVLVKSDNMIYDAGLDVGVFNDLSLSGSLYLVFEELGNEFIACDGEVSDNEIRDLTKYLNMLKNYINSEIKDKNKMI